jgi:hypothetical protein
MRAAPEEFKRHFLIGVFQHNDQSASRTLAEKLGDGFRWTRRQRRFEDQNVSGKSLNGDERLIEAFGLADDAYVVFERKDLAKPSAKNGLRIRHNYADRAFAVLRLRTNA